MCASKYLDIIFVRLVFDTCHLQTFDNILAARLGSENVREALCRAARGRQGTCLRHFNAALVSPRSVRST